MTNRTSVRLVRTPNPSEQLWLLSAVPGLVIRVRTITVPTPSAWLAQRLLLGAGLVLHMRNGV